MYIKAGLKVDLAKSIYMGLNGNTMNKSLKFARNIMIGEEEGNRRGIKIKIQQRK